MSKRNIKSLVLLIVMEVTAFHALVNFLLSQANFS